MDAILAKVLESAGGDLALSVLILLILIGFVKWLIDRQDRRSDSKDAAHAKEREELMKKHQDSLTTIKNELVTAVNANTNAVNTLVTLAAASNARGEHSAGILIKRDG